MHTSYAHSLCTQLTHTTHTAYAHGLSAFAHGLCTRHRQIGVPGASASAAAPPPTETPAPHSTPHFFSFFFLPRPQFSFFFHCFFPHFFSSAPQNEFFLTHAKAGLLATLDKGRAIFILSIFPLARHKTFPLFSLFFSAPLPPFFLAFWREGGNGGEGSANLGLGEGVECDVVGAHVRALPVW